jgi:hypothetical protein
MSVPKKQSLGLEKLKTGDFINGEIVEIQEDLEHTFKGFQGKPDTIQPAVRFVFKFDDYKFNHFSRWMKFSYFERANLYIKYISELVENAYPDMDFDIQELVGMKIKAIWKDEANGFQSIQLVKPLKSKLTFINQLNNNKDLNDKDFDEDDIDSLNRLAQTGRNESEEYEDLSF